MSAQRMAPLAVLSGLSAVWAVYLVKLHNDAVAATLQPGLLCGEDGGCGDVLASAWSVLPGGIPVSAPAVPMYLVIAALAGMALAGRLEAKRAASLGALGGLGGLAFGGWLLYQMLASVGSVCNYCLVMDGLNLGVLAAALLAHPDGPGAALAGIPEAVGQMFRPAPEAALLPALVAGTLAVHLALPAPEGPSEADIAAAVEAATASVAAEPPAATSAGKAKAKAAPAGAAAETGEQKRVVLQAAAADFDLAGIPVKGPASAPVSVVLFEDFQCPYCRKLAGNLTALQASRPDQVKIAWYNFPMHTACNADAPKDMHPRACAAAAAGVCAQEQGKFWEMHDMLFFNSAKLSDRELRSYAGELGLDVRAFDACMRKPETEARVRADAAVGKAAGVSGTPTFFINGRRLSGAQPVEVLEAVVDTVLAADKGEDERVILDVALRGEVTGELPADTPTEIRLDGPYGKFTIDAFEAHVVDGVAMSRPGAEATRGLSWYDAQEACEAAGKRLCTEEEWLTACTGALPEDEDGDGVYSDDRIQGRRQPYGAYLQPTWCASARAKDDPRPLTTGTHPRCATPEGVFDMEGNLKEWIGLSPDRAGLKGGSYYSRDSARCGYLRDDQPPDSGDGSIGFRCCRGSEPATADTERYPGGKVGDQLRDWTLPRIDGGELSRADLEGRAIVMTFWATWCGPCKAELPILAELHERYKDQGLVVVGVNIDKDVRKARAYTQRSPLPFPVVLDTDSALMEQFDAQSLPTAFWITHDGRIRQKTTGFSEEHADDLERYVAELLAR